MGLKQDLEAINTSTRKVLADCNAAAKLTPAENLKEIPRLIEDAAQWGYTEGDAVGYSIGYKNGYSIGQEEEQQRAYDEKWDAIQLSDGVLGNNYMYAFAGRSWTNKTFKPKYNLTVRYGDRMFAEAWITDLQAILDEQGVTMTLVGAGTGAGNAPSQIFMGSYITRVGVLDCSQFSQLNYFLYQSQRLVTVEKLILKTGVKQYNLTTTFQQCYALENITIEGNITNVTSFADSTKLSRTSIESIIASLWDSATEGSNTITFSQTAVSNAFSTEEWETLIATKPNWTITLA